MSLRRPLPWRLHWGRFRPNDETTAPCIAAVGRFARTYSAVTPRVRSIHRSRRSILARVTGTRLAKRALPAATARTWSFSPSRAAAHGLPHFRMASSWSISSAAIRQLQLARSQWHVPHVIADHHRRLEGGQRTEVHGAGGRRHRSHLPFRQAAREYELAAHYNAVKPDFAPTGRYAFKLQLMFPKQSGKRKWHHTNTGTRICLLALSVSIHEGDLSEAFHYF
jgi:hypothetical protein